MEKGMLIPRNLRGKHRFTNIDMKQTLNRRVDTLFAAGAQSNGQFNVTTEDETTDCGREGEGGWSGGSEEA